jgi:hypothetical protein
VSGLKVTPNYGKSDIFASGTQEKRDFSRFLRNFSCTFRHTAYFKRCSSMDAGMKERSALEMPDPPMLHV